MNKIETRFGAKMMNVRCDDRTVICFIYLELCYFMENLTNEDYLLLMKNKATKRASSFYVSISKEKQQDISWVLSFDQFYKYLMSNTIVFCFTLSRYCLLLFHLKHLENSRTLGCTFLGKNAVEMHFDTRSNTPAVYVLYRLMAWWNDMDSYSYDKYLEHNSHQRKKIHKWRTYWGSYKFNTKLVVGCLDSLRDQPTIQWPLRDKISVFLCCPSADCTQT